MKPLQTAWLTALLMIPAAVVMAEDITLTTYYPSPRGVYNELRAANNVAIGMTTPPASRLEIRGSGTTNTTSSLNVTNSAGTSLLYVRDDGRVGIGTTGPGARLDIVHDPTTEPIVRLVNARPSVGSALNVVLSLRNTFFNYTPLEVRGSGTIIQYNTAGVSLNQITAGGNSFFTGGNVGIGTTTPATTLHVDGTVRLTNLPVAPPDTSPLDGMVLTYNAATGNLEWRYPTYQ